MTHDALHAPARRQHTIVQHQIDVRSRCQHSQPFEELERLEFEMRRAIAPAMPQRQPHRTLAVHFQPILRQQGPQRLPTQPLKPERMRKERRSAGATAFERCGAY